MSGSNHAKVLDPLNFNSVADGSFVDVSGARFKYRVREVHKDHLLLVECLETEGSVFSNEITINAHAVIGKFGVRPGDKIKVIYRNGRSEIFQIDLIADKGGLLLISPPSRKQSLSITDKLRLLWRIKGL